MKTFRHLTELFGLRPLFGYHDLDLLHETSPGDGQEIPVSSSELGAEASTHSSLSTQGVDGPAVQGGEASAAGHPNSDVVDWGAVREGIAELRTVLVDALAWLDEIDPTAAGLTKAKVRYDTSINVVTAPDELALRRQQAMQLPYWPI